VGQQSRPTEIRMLRSNHNPIVNSPESLVEGEDFYWEGDAMVFTARYHLRRGYCCDSGCRNCPYGEARVKAPDGFARKVTRRFEGDH
jgi:hypothetical protein